MGVIANWFGNENEGKVLIIDTPGLGDSDRRDTNHITNMAKSIKAIGYVHTFLIVINSENPRFDE